VSECKAVPALLDSRAGDEFLGLARDSVVRNAGELHMILVANLRKNFGALVAVDGVSFEIAGGETFGLLGPNGAGKTTTINMLSGLLSPDGGEIHINGAADPTLPSVRRNLGITPQSLALYEDLTGRENLEFYGRLYGLRSGRLGERVNWALDFTGLSERRNDRVGVYSGGMKRRLNLAVSLLHDPPVLLMDEPTVGVDPQSRNLIFDNIEGLKREGRTILYTTHYMEEAQRLCDRVAIMDRGRILALDTVPGLIAAHGGTSLVDAELGRLPDDPSTLPWQLDGKRLHVVTQEPLEVVGRMATFGLNITALKIDRPDLEDVFLNLTGRRLRDE
jgi:ABC-2 type transport system ATP-binding protein